jgi:hypothetical protein
LEYWSVGGPVRYIYIYELISLSWGSDGDKAGRWQPVKTLSRQGETKESENEDEERKGSRTKPWYSREEGGGWDEVGEERKKEEKGKKRERRKKGKRGENEEMRKGQAAQPEAG